MNDNDNNIGSKEPNGLRDDEEIIELPDDVSSQSEDIETIIELTDIVRSASESDEMLLDSTDASSIMTTEDDAAMEALDEDELIDGILEKALELEESIDEELETERIVDEEFVDSIGIEVESETLDSDDVIGMPEPDPETTRLKDLEYLSNLPSTDEDEEMDDFPDSISITQDQLEAALERVIHKIFSEKIEGMLVDVVEKVVKQEIEKLNVLLEDSTDNG